MKEPECANCGHTLDEHCPPRVPEELSGPCRVMMPRMFDRGRDLRPSRGVCPCERFVTHADHHRDEIPAWEQDRERARHRT